MSNKKKTNDFIQLIFLFMGYILSMQQRLFCASGICPNALLMIAQMHNILTSSRLLHVVCEHSVVKGIKKIIQNCEKKTSGISEKCTRPNWPPRLECWQENQSSFWLVQFLPAHLTSSHLFCFVGQTKANNKQWYGRSFLLQTPCSRRLGRAVR